MLNRRLLITGLISFVAAPAIVRVESLMKIKVDKFDPKEAWEKLLASYEPIEYKYTPISLMWIDNVGKIHNLSVEESSIYLDSLND